MTNLTKGILLCAFGKRGYIWAAYNFAFSIKTHSPGVPITILTDGSFDTELFPEQKWVFDTVIKIPADIMFPNGRLSPGNIKTSIYQFLQYDYNLFLDVDALLLSDINVIFDELIAAGGYYYSHVNGLHRIEMGNDIPEMFWAYANDVWSHFSLSKDAVLPATNSSFQFIKRCPESEAMFTRLRQNWNNPLPMRKLRNQWGGQQPDELYLNVTLAQLGITGETPRKYLWMATEPTDLSLTEMGEKYPILCLFGTDTANRLMYIEYYDRCLIRWHFAHKQNHNFKWGMIAVDKHANTRPIEVPQEIINNDIAQLPDKLPVKAALFLSWFTSDDPERQKELMTVLEKNAANPVIDDIYLVTEQEVAYPVPSRCTIIPVNNRPTYEQLIKIAESTAGKEAVKIISNADIYFDEVGMKRIKNIDYSTGCVVALSRYDVKPDGSFQHFNYEMSQDVWCWSGYLNMEGVVADYPLGLLGCDNRIAFELGKHHEVINPSFSIRAFHLHNSGGRKYTEATRIHGDYRAVYAEGDDKYRRKNLLLMQPGKTGDIILCLPMAKELSKKYNVYWLCPGHYHELFDYVDYCTPVSEVNRKYDETLDLAFGLGGSPEGWWQQNKTRFDSFVTAKYELAGLPVELKKTLDVKFDMERAEALYKIIVSQYGERYFVAHENSTYGTAITLPNQTGAGAKVPFIPVENYTIFDWVIVLQNATEIHCIDSSLCNLVDVLPPCNDIPKFYYPTNKVPNQWDKTLLYAPNWNTVQQ